MRSTGRTSPIPSLPSSTGVSPAPGQDADPAQPGTRRPSWLWRAGPSWVVATTIYALWLTLTFRHEDLPAWLLLPLGSVVIAWHGSLQHEAVHGQLAPRRWLNDLPALLPLALWIPFPIYRATHRAHHQFEILTEPARDPESFYVTRATWDRLGSPARGFLRFHNTLLGRLTLGPLLVIGQFWWAEARALLKGDYRHLESWLWHGLGLALVLSWVVLICGLPLWAYVTLFVLPGTSLTLVRSFAEHKAAHTPYERTAVVEAGPFFSLLFFNNNLHFAHHKRPDLPWHALPAYYAREREPLLAENGGLLYQGGYLEIARRFFFRPVDTPVHPFI